MAALPRLGVGLSDRRDAFSTQTAGLSQPGSIIDRRQPELESL